MNKDERLNGRIEAAERSLARTLDIRERVIREIVRTERKLKLLQSELERLKRVRVKRLAEAAPILEYEAAERKKVEAAGPVGNIEPAPANGDKTQECQPESPVTAVVATPVDDGLPDYLRRDKLAREKIQAELHEKKKLAAGKLAERRQIKREHVKADLTGATRKMPVEGKAALAAIRQR